MDIAWHTEFNINRDGGRTDAKEHIFCPAEKKGKASIEKKI